MIQPVTTDARYETILERTTDDFTRAIESVIRAEVQRRDRWPSLERLGLVIGRNMALAQLLGRESTARTARAIHSARGRYAGKPVAVVHHVPFTEAIRAILDRTPEVAKHGTPEAVRAIIERHGFTLAKTSELPIIERVQKAIRGFIEKGVSNPDASDIIAEMGDWTRSYGETVYRTNIARAFTEGRVEQVREPDMRAAIPALRFSAVGDADTRPNHKAADGLIAPVGHILWSTFTPPLGFQCFLPGTLVSGRFVGGLKARYSGPAVEIHTRNGARISVTVNHPVLTENGWRAAGRISKGDNLFRYGSGIESFGDRSWDGSLPSVPVSRRAVHDQESPSRVEDVFEALGRDGTGPRRIVSRARILPLDLHGDARFTDGEIEVVRAARFLPRHPLPDLLQDGDDFLLMFSESTRPSGHHPRLQKTLLDPDDATAACRPCAGTLALDDLSVIGSESEPGPLQPLCIGAASQIHASVSQDARQWSSADPAFLRQLQEACPVEIIADEVVHVRHFNFSGHVFDLETEGGWIVSENIITSNCRCSADFVDVFDYEEMQKRRGFLRGDGVHLPSTFGGAHPDPGFITGR